MGEPVRIRDLAEQMIRFYGLEPENDIGIEYTGLRAGERLGEKLWWDYEIKQPTGFDRILKLEYGGAVENPDINAIMKELKPVCYFDPARPEKYRDSAFLRNILREYVPGYAEKNPAEKLEKKCIRSELSLAYE
jgi:FlaA1/EpsC-like NDP-sugar epimerase